MYIQDPGYCASTGLKDLGRLVLRDAFLFEDLSSIFDHSSQRDGEAGRQGSGLQAKDRQEVVHEGLLPDAQVHQVKRKELPEPEADRQKNTIAAERHQERLQVLLPDQEELLLIVHFNNCSPTQHYTNTLTSNIPSHPLTIYQHTH